MVLTQWTDLSLKTLATDNSIELFWVPVHRGIDGYVRNQVPGHRGIDGNEKADALAKRGVETPYFGLESVCGISMRTAKPQLNYGLGKDIATAMA